MRKCGVCEGELKRIPGRAEDLSISWYCPKCTNLGDPVNHPSHYTQGGIECIDAIEAALGREGFIAFLRGQVIKYQWRLGHKDAPAQDNAKASWYAARLQKVLDEPVK